MWFRITQKTINFKLKLVKVNKLYGQNIRASIDFFFFFWKLMMMKINTFITKVATFIIVNRVKCYTVFISYFKKIISVVSLLCKVSIYFKNNCINLRNKICPRSYTPIIKHNWLHFWQNSALQPQFLTVSDIWHSVFPWIICWITMDCFWNYWKYIILFLNLPWSMYRREQKSNHPKLRLLLRVWKVYFAKHKNGLTAPGGGGCTPQLTCISHLAPQLPVPKFTFGNIDFPSSLRRT